MPLFTSGVWFLGVLLSFTSVVSSRDVDPTEDFCDLSAHMSEAPSNLPKNFFRFSLTEGRIFSGSERWRSLHCGRMDAVFFRVHQLQWP